MKKLSSRPFGVYLPTFVFSLILIQVASAATTLPFYDGFASSLTPDGGALTNVDATWTNTAGFPNIIVGSAYAQSYAGLQTPASGSKGAHLWNGSSAAAGVQIATTATSGSVYASFLLKVTTNTTGSRVIFEMNTSSAGSVSAPPFGVALNSDTTLSLFKTLLVTNKTSALTVGTTYFVVVRYNFIGSVTNDTLDLWLNPDASTFGPSGTPPTATIAGVGFGNTNALTGFRTVNFGLFTSTVGAYDFDEVRAGTAWADVTPIDIAAAVYYQSRQSGAWSDYNTWNRSTDGVTFSPATAGQIPTNTDYVTNLVGHAVTVSSAAGAATLTVRGSLTVGAGVLTASQVAVDGGTLDITTNATSAIGAVTLLNGGHINGTSGTLSATGYTIAAGTASANLGGALATMSVTGSAVLNGTNTFGGVTTVYTNSSLPPMEISMLSTLMSLLLL